MCIRDRDVTYKIKKDKNGKQSLRFFSFIPVQQNMVRPSNCAVYRYGNPGVMISGPGFNDQQVNIRGNQGNGSVGIQMNGGGVNMNAVSYTHLDVYKRQQLLRLHLERLLNILHRIYFRRFLDF